MSRQQDCTRHAANCVKLASAAKNENDRRRWLEMQQFWLRRAQLNDDAESEAHPNVVKL